MTKTFSKEERESEGRKWTLSEITLIDYPERERVG